MTKYVNLRETTDLQYDIMLFVDKWVRSKKIPVPRKEIIKEMEAKSYTKYAVKNALHGLLKMGYLRIAVLGADDALNKVSFVQLRRV